MAWLNMARNYHDAARELFAAHERRVAGGEGATLVDPLYFMYLHTAELALKAYIVAHGCPIQKTHRLVDLYKESRTLGLVIDPDDRVTIKNVVELLDSGNKHQGYRYFNLNFTIRASPPWIRDVVSALVEAVARKVDLLFPDSTVSGTVAKLTLTIDEPRSKGSS